MMNKFQLAIITCCLLFISVIASAQVTVDTQKAFEQVLLKDPALARYYTFEDALDANAPGINLASDTGDFEFKVATGPADQPLVLTEGRVPGTKAVNLDSAFLEAVPVVLSERAFTVAGWFRTHGLGILRGDSIPTGANLMSMGGGYWDGFRVNVRYPEGSLGFEIGRPGSSQGLAGGFMSDSLWHHLAVTWDGAKMRIYLNGLLMAEGEHSGDFTLPQANMGLRLGFNGSGWGSAVMDVDELVFLTRSMNAVEIAQLATTDLTSPVSDEVKAVFNKNLTGDKASADDLYALLKTNNLTSSLQNIIQVNLIRTLMQTHKGNEAAQELAKLFAQPQVAEGLRATALIPLLSNTGLVEGMSSDIYVSVLSQVSSLTSKQVFGLQLALAQAYVAEGQVEKAREVFSSMMSSSDLPLRKQLDARLQWAHSLAGRKEWQPAREAYEEIFIAEEAPVQYKSLALLCIASTWREEQNWDKARATYERLTQLEKAPPPHLLEAEECVAEINRLAEGLPARDPQYSRMQVPVISEFLSEFFISPQGNDETGDGTVNAPYATLEKARDVVREYRFTNGELEAPVAITLLPGVYERTSTFLLEPDDSGTTQSPTIIRAAEKGTVVLNGGIQLKGFTLLQDEATLARLPEEARGKVYELNLYQANINDLGRIPSWGVGHPGEPFPEIFFNGKAQHLSRWPNEGWLTTGEILPIEGNGRPAFRFSDDRMKRWNEAKDPFTLGYFKFLWADDGIPVEIDAEQGIISLNDSANYGLNAGNPFYVLNLLEEIDAPGEWYLDRETGVLYFYPPSDPNQADVRFSMLNEAFVEAEGVKNIRFEGLTLELGRYDGITLTNCNDCLITACTIRQLGGTAITITGGFRDGIFGCDLYELGRNGTWVKGGDRRTLEPGGHFVENCDVHHFSRIWRTYTPAVFMDGVGNRIAHNSFHDTPAHAIRLEGNEHMLEYNDVFRVVQETDDQGGLDMWFNHGYRRNIIRYNFWHDIPPNDRPCGKAGIRLDDAISGQILYGNIFYRCSQGGFGGLQIHGGKENWVDNNIFADCSYAISFSGWGETGWKNFIESEGTKNSLYQDVDIDSELYTTRYPELGGLLENEGMSFVWRNMVYNCGAFMTRDREIQDVLDNIVTTKDPGFVDAKQGNFALPLTSALLPGTGFRPIAVDEIGLYEHPLRASWPVGK